MSKSAVKILCGAGFVLLAQVLLAQRVLADKIDIDMKPGLWETNVTLDGDGSKQLSAQMEQANAAMAEMKKQMAAMPAEQRRQMEAMMAQSGMSVSEQGVNLNDQIHFSGKGVKSKNCVTQAQIDSGDLGDNEEGCTSSIKKISAMHFKSTQKCSGEDNSHSEMDVVFKSPKSYTGKGTMTQVVNGKPHVMKISMQGNWLASECGNIKPD